MQLQDLGDEEAEFAIAENGHGSADGYAHLVEDFAGGGKRFGEDGVEGRYLRRYFVEVLFGEGEKFSERSRMADNAEDGAVQAVPPEAFCAKITISAGEIDFPNHFFPKPPDVITGGDFSYKLVAGRSGEAVVSTLELEIGRADAGVEETDEGIAGGA